MGWGWSGLLWIVITLHVEIEHPLYGLEASFVEIHSKYVAKADIATRPDIGS